MGKLINDAKLAIEHMAIIEFIREEGIDPLPKDIPYLTREMKEEIE